MLIGKKRINVAKKNIDLCLTSFSQEKKDQILKDNISHACQAFFDTGIAWFWNDRRIEKNVQYKINGLKEISNAKEGVLIIFKHSLHLELDARILGMNQKIYGVGRKHNSKYMEHIIAQGRKRGLKDILYKDEMLRFIRWLKSGKKVLYAIDQDYGIKHSKKVNFFGIDTYTINSVERFQELSNFEIFFLNSFYQKSCLNLDLIKMQKNSNGIVSTEDLKKVIQDSIQHNPHEYLWQHKRFKSTLGKDFYS